MNKQQGQLQQTLEEFIHDLPRGIHLTAPEVYKRAKENGLKVSLSTVYRTLNHLSEQGQVQALSGEHGRRYESAGVGHDHDHLICLKCGLTIEFEDDLIGGFGRTVAERKGYDYHNSRFDILGLCPQCKVAKSADRDVINMLASLSDQAETLAQACQQTLELVEEQEIRHAKKILTKTRIADFQKEIDKILTLMDEIQP